MNCPNFSFEQRLWDRGYGLIAGLDEVGRGSFAGPVVAAAVAFAPISNVQFPISNEDGKKIVINDSKKLTSKQRLVASGWIKNNSAGWGVGEVSVAHINRAGITRATQMAFRKAVVDANERVDNGIEYLLVDAFYVPNTRGFPVDNKKERRNRQAAIIKGDEKSLSIAAASIIAKVYRDGLMERISGKKEYRRYEWYKNKGYGTRAHREAIIKHGITNHHRKSFVSNYLNDE